jgi:hypothetical protein
VQQADAIGNQAERGKDARGFLDLSVAKAPRTVCRAHGITEYALQIVPFSKGRTGLQGAALSMAQRAN